MLYKTADHLKWNTSHRKSPFRANTEHRIMINYLCYTNTHINVLIITYFRGMSKEQWKKLKEKEANKSKGKNLGAVGITSFKSRSFAQWQKAGGKNLFPVDPNSVKDPSEIPYM